MPLTTETKGNIIEIADNERQPCEIWDRAMGYYRPVTVDAYKTAEWNKGKVQEHKDRLRFKENI